MLWINILRQTVSLEAKEGKFKTHGEESKRKPVVRIARDSICRKSKEDNGEYKLEESEDGDEEWCLQDVISWHISLGRQHFKVEPLPEIFTLGLGD